MLRHDLYMTRAQTYFTGEMILGESDKESLYCKPCYMLVQNMAVGQCAKLFTKLSYIFKRCVCMLFLKGFESRYSKPQSMLPYSFALETSVRNSFL